MHIVYTQHTALIEALTVASAARLLCAHHTQHPFDMRSNCGRLVRRHDLVLFGAMAGGCRVRMDECHTSEHGTHLGMCTRARNAPVPVEASRHMCKTLLYPSRHLHMRETLLFPSRHLDTCAKRSFPRLGI